MAPAAALAMQAKECVLDGGSGVDWSLIQLVAPHIMKHEPQPQSLMSTLAKVGGIPPLGLYTSLLRHGFTLGGKGPGAWSDASPLLHAIKAVDSDAFIGLLLSSLTQCVEPDEEAITAAPDHSAAKSAHKSSLSAKKRNKLKKLAKERKRRGKETMKHEAMH